MPRILHILLVEDLETHRLLIQRAIERHQGEVRCVVHAVADGDGALDFLRASGAHRDAPRPHLILLDIRMPGKSGFEVLQEIKGDRELRRIPTVMLTSSQQEEDVEKSYALGGCGYVTKPEGIEGMRSRLGRVIDYWSSVALLP